MNKLSIKEPGNMAMLKVKSNADLTSEKNILTKFS